MIHSFEVYNAAVFSRVIEMYIHHHNLRTSSSRPKGSSYPLAVTPYPLPMPLPEPKEPPITL